jgi:predicted homoserine dehydrogenase-like protein
MEVPVSAALISLYGRATMQPLDHLAAEVTTIAKRDLRPGELLEGIGERTHHAGCMVYAEARRAKALPIGLAKGCKMRCPAAKGSLITWDMVEPAERSILYDLRAEQDKFSEGLV